MGAIHATATITRRRPMRSASTAAGSAKMMPARTIAPAYPTPASPTPKSSAANSAVWVKSVFTNAALIDAAASRPMTNTCVVSRRSGGDQKPRCEIRRRMTWPTGSLNSHPNHGMVSR